MNYCFIKDNRPECCGNSIVKIRASREIMPACRAMLLVARYNDEGKLTGDAGSGLPLTPRQASRPSAPGGDAPYGGSPLSASLGKRLARVPATLTGSRLRAFRLIKKMFPQTDIDQQYQKIANRTNTGKKNAENIADIYHLQSRINIIQRYAQG